MRRFFAPAIAIATGLLVLLGYFLPTGFLAGLRITFVQWAAILVGAAVFLGVFNLLGVHIKKILTKEKGSGYSFLLIASLLITLVIGMLTKPNAPIMTNIFNAVIIPVETSLMAIMAVTLVYAGIRLLRHRNDLMAFILLFTALIVMLGSAPLPFSGVSFLNEFSGFFGGFIRPTIIRVLASSGARGILLGVALGTLLTSLRILMGADRPYGGNK